MVNREISNFVESRLKSGSSRGRAVAFQSISFSIIYDTSKWYLLPFVSPSTCTVLLLGCCRANYNSFHLICQMTGQHSVWVCIYCSINRWAVFLREKHPLQLLHTKKGVGLFWWWDYFREITVCTHAMIHELYFCRLSGTFTSWEALPH